MVLPGRGVYRPGSEQTRMPLPTEVLPRVEKLTSQTHVLSKRKTRRPTRNVAHRLSRTSRRSPQARAAAPVPRLSRSRAPPPLRQ